PKATDMTFRLAAKDPGFEKAFETVLHAKREVSEDVNKTVAAIIADVRARGDAALVDYTAKFDRLELTAETLRVPEADLAAAEAKCEPKTVEALKLAAERIAAFHQR